MPGRRAIAVAVAALSLLALAVVRAAGGGGPPLYDGVCLTPHYLLLGASPGPSSASMTFSATDLAGTVEMATSDPTPQAQLIIAAGSFVIPPGATVTISITPVAAPSAKPADGTIAGNVYSVLAKASTGQVLALVAAHPATVVLAAPSATGQQLTLEHLDGSTWTGLKTFQSGCGDTDEAAAPSLGLFALVGSGSSTAPSPAAASGAPVALIVVAVLVVLLSLAIGATRLSRRRR
jgi:hypothetical protein